VLGYKNCAVTEWLNKLFAYVWML